MQIHGISQLHGAQPINSPHRSLAAESTRPSTSLTPTDQLEISPEAQLAVQLRAIPDIREDRVAEIRAAIANGSYETEDRLDLALDRLLDEIGG